MGLRSEGRARIFVNGRRTEPLAVRNILSPYRGEQRKRGEVAGEGGLYSCESSLATLDFLRAALFL